MHQESGIPVLLKMPTAKALILAFIFLFYISGTTSTRFIFKNNCPYTIWPATKSDSGVPISSGFTLNPGASSTLIVEPLWLGRVWARTNCVNDPTSKKFVCGNGDCATGQVSCLQGGPILPATVIEFNLNEHFFDYYDVSLVNGYNLPVIVTPVDRKSGSKSTSCNPTSCASDLNKSCPLELAVKDQSGKVIGCKSACLAFNQPQYCCTGTYSTPKTCLPTRYSSMFKKHCPEAHSYVYDNQTSTPTCPETLSDYVITFCP